MNGLCICFSKKKFVFLERTGILLVTSTMLYMINKLGRLCCSHFLLVNICSGDKCTKNIFAKIKLCNILVEQKESPPLHSMAPIPNVFLAFLTAKPLSSRHSAQMASNVCSESYPHTSCPAPHCNSHRPFNTLKETKKQELGVSHWQ